MSIGSVALKSGIGIGVATAIGTFIAHEKLENDNQWTSANSSLSMMTQVGVLGGAVTAMAAGAVIGGTRGNIATGIGGGILFGGLVGNLAGLGAAAIIP